MSKLHDVRPGDEIVAAQFGPLTIQETVRWAGVQENWDGVHWDRESVRQKSKLRTFIASGTFRQALLTRALTDWMGPMGSLKKLKLRHVAPTYEGDLQRYFARVTDVVTELDRKLVSCDLEGLNQNGERIMVGSCVMALRYP